MVHERESILKPCSQTPVHGAIHPGMSMILLQINAVGRRKDTEPEGFVFVAFGMTGHFFPLRAPTAVSSSQTP